MSGNIFLPAERFCLSLRCHFLAVS